MPSVKKRLEYKLTLGKSVDGSLMRKSFYSTRSKSDAKKKAERYQAQYELEHCAGEGSCTRTMKFSA